MPKEVKVYEADDKKAFKTRSGAENHNKKLAQTKRDPKGSLFSIPSIL